MTKNGKKTATPETLGPAAAGTGARVDAFVRLLPLAAALALPPLLVLRADVGLPMEAFDVWYRNADLDLLSWWKSVAVVAAALWALAAAALLAFRGWRPAERVWGMACLAPLLATFLSALLSRFPDTVWIGFPEHYEGFFSRAGLLVLAWLAAELPDDRGRCEWLVRAMAPAFLVNALLGAAQSRGYNYLLADPVAALVGLGRDGLALTPGGSSFGTLPNPNAFSRFMAMGAILALAMAARAGGRARVFWLFCLAACGWALATNPTRGGVVALAAGLLFLAVAVWGARGRNADSRTPVGRRRGLVLGAAGALLILGLAFHSFMPASIPAASRLFGKFRGALAEAEWGGDGQFRLSGLTLRNNVVGIHAGGGVVAARRMVTGEWVFERESPEPAEILEAETTRGGEGGSDRYTLAALPGFVLEQEASGERAAVLRMEGIAFEIRERGGVFYGLDGRGRWSRDIGLPKTALFAGVPGLFSARGYVWSRALGAAGDHPFFGSGPDTFCLVFPNDEIVRKARFFSPDTVVDKADGSWVNILTTLGWVGLLAWLLPVVYALRAAMRTPDEPLVVSLTAMIVVYGVGSLVTNSTSEASPAFWIACGLLVALKRSGDRSASGE